MDHLHSDGSRPSEIVTPAAECDARSALTSEVFHGVPTGYASALPATEIWIRMNCWAKTSVRHTLRELAAQGKIQCRPQNIPGGFQWIFWRETA